MTRGMSDDELLAAWRSGRDEAAAAEICRRYATRVTRLASKQIGERLRQRVDEEDIANSVFKSLFRRNYEIRCSSSLWDLLARITINKVRRQVENHSAKKRDYRKEVDDGNVSFEALITVPPEESADILTVELNDLLDRLLVSDRERRIVRLCLEGFSTSEIGDRIRCSRTTVRRILNRVGHRLEQRLEEDSDD